MNDGRLHRGMRPAVFLYAIGRVGGCMRVCGRMRPGDPLHTHKIFGLNS